MASVLAYSGNNLGISHDRRECDYDKRNKQWVTFIFPECFLLCMNKVSINFCLNVLQSLYVCVIQRLPKPLGKLHIHYFYFNVFLFYYMRLRMAHWVRQLDYLATHTSLSPIRRGFAPGFINYKKGYTRIATASDQVYQLHAHGRWFSPGTPVSSTTKTGRHDIAEILLKVALNTIINKSINQLFLLWYI